ncbi:hypothetical protein ALC60_05172 [Trachymyrmex zeteki]|uniref:Uncharacterized protein n=1 Tax=Mycetomoellerius zeteki TaxID=64791 RepID=A0A151X6G0_9HYME|nr:hypothetical protein ALC60_05172 [Trachymyrmex zeteki]
MANDSCCDRCQDASLPLSSYRRASLKNLVVIRGKSGKNGKREEKDESFEDCERQKNYRTYAKSLSYLSRCTEFTSQVERIQLCWNLALVTRNASLERAISPTAITLTCIIGICVGDASSQYTMTGKTNSSTVYTSNTPLQSLTDLVVAIASPNIRGHVLSSNDPNRNYSGPPTEIDPQRCIRKCIPLHVLDICQSNN